MIRPLVPALILAGAAGWANAAAACTVIVPMPRPGESFEQAAARAELEAQQLLMRQADSVFLGQASYDAADRNSRLTTVAPLHGRHPPRQSLIRDRQGCGGVWVGAHGRVVVFAAQIDMRDDPWKPWRWGRWVVIGWRPVADVIEPRLTARLRGIGSGTPHD